MNLIVPPGYAPILDARHTERAIGLLKEHFQSSLAYELNLVRVTAPLFVLAGTGINDDLNGIERPVSFGIGAMEGARAEVVQSLAKWKRMTLGDLGFSVGEGIYTDMNAVRPDDAMDNLHSIYVDQWDWELVIDDSCRTVDYLKRIVVKVYDVIRRTERYICYEFEGLTPELPETITFVHADDLARRFPDLSSKERELQVCREHGAVFVIGIGGDLSTGEPHDGRAPDYDDWSTPTGDGYAGLNGDILVYNRLLDLSFELSSMGIRVDPTALERQLTIRGAQERRELYFHRHLLEGDLPLTIGGGIGQSRLAMLYLRKAHIGEIQASIWPENLRDACRRSGIPLL